MLLLKYLSWYKKWSSTFYESMGQWLCTEKQFIFYEGYWTCQEKHNYITVGYEIHRNDKFLKFVYKWIGHNILYRNIMHCAVDLFLS